MYHPLLFMMGYRRISVPREEAAEICELCRKRGLIYRNLSFGEDAVTLDCSPRMAKRLKAEADAADIPVGLSELCGLPGVLLRARYRFGILAGLLFCLFLFVWSESVLFSIRVDGNDRLSDEQIIEELAANGLSVGDPIRGLDTMVLENRVLIASEEIAWISINLRGNVANVVVRERQAPPKEEEMSASNLVASGSGIIEWMEEIRGQIMVEVGDAVGKGDLLVSGIRSKEDGPLHLSLASGRVIARTSHSFEIRIPLSYEKKEYTGRVFSEKYLIFLEKEIKIFSNAGNLPPTCDTIERVEHFSLQEDRALPVGIRTVEYPEYRTVTAQRSPDAAEELAYYYLRLQMENEVPEGMLVEKSLRTELTDEEFVLYCDAEYLEDIAEVKKIEVEGSLAPEKKE